MTEISSISGRRMGKGLQWEAAAVEAGVSPVAVWCSCASPTEDIQLHLAQEGFGEGYFILHTKYGTPGLPQGRLRQFEFLILITSLYCRASHQHCLQQSKSARLPLSLDIFCILEEYTKYVGFPQPCG